MPYHLPHLPDHIKTTKLDYYGVPYEAYERISRKPDLGKLWQQFSREFRSQPPRDTRGHNAYNPPMDVIEWKELNRE
jgi:hypothetical protein